MDLKIFATTIEQEAVSQVYRLAGQTNFRDAKIRIMPDAHAGAGCTIGFTADLGDKVVPNLVGVDIGCFTEDTKVKLADGRDLTFKELIEEDKAGKNNYCYSFDENGNIVISKISLPRKIKTVDDIIVITLDNGEIIKCTTDHIFYDINLNEITAENLSIGTKLFPLYIDKAENHKDEITNKQNKKIKTQLYSYSVVYQPTSKRWSYVHYLADEYNYRNNRVNTLKSFVRHHKDFNKYNNSPENIERLSYKDHWLLHSTMVKHTNRLGISGFKAAAKNNKDFYSNAGKKRSYSTWHGKNAEKNKIEASNRTKILNEKGILNSVKQREKNRQKQLTNNTTKFSEQNKDENFKNIQQLSKLRKILLLCHNDFSEKSYNLARKNVYNGFTWLKAKEISEKNNLTFEDIVNYKNHVVVNIQKIHKKTDVYCLTNFEFGNFALSSGVFVHNCGMLVANIGNVDLDLAELDKVIRETIPSGGNVNTKQGTRIYFEQLEDMVMYKHLRNIDHLQSSIGTLGSGNHFIEIDVDEDGNKYIVIHSGSRNLGQQVCKHYQNLAIDQCNAHTKEIKTEINETIARLKKEGRQKESSKAIKEIKEKYNRIDKVPTDICYLTGDLRQDYLHDMKLCQEFAWQNRLEMLRRILKGMKIKNVVEQWQTVHNYIDFSDNIIRKGAIRCNAGEKVIIPLNMRDGSIIAVGKGNEDWNNSGPHGAGRLMSRRVAKESLSMNDFKKSMEGIFTTCVNRGTIDESPMAYKNAQEIIDGIAPTADVVNIIKPIYNFKATEIEKKTNE